MRRPTALLLATGLSITFLFGAPLGAEAQFSSESGSAIDIAADHTDFQSNQCMVHYTGAVEVLQKDDRLRSDSLKVFTKQLGPSRSSDSGPNCGDTDHIDADGGVYYVTPKEIVKADHAVYNADAKTVVFTGQVIVAQGKNVMAGTRFLIHTDTHDAQMESDVTGRGNPGRVRSIIYPKSASGAPGTATSPPGSPSPPTPPPPRQHGAG